MSINRRDFLKIAGASALMSDAVLSAAPAEARVWTKAGTVQLPGTIMMPKKTGRKNNTISCGYHESYALRSDGYVFTCGYGAAGAGNYNKYSTFTPCPGISNITSVVGLEWTAGALALRSDGMVFVTGNDGYGWFGINFGGGGSAVNFVISTTISNVVAVAGGFYFALALRSDGLLFGCGNNSAGQLGLGNTADQSSFTQCLGLSNISAISAAYEQSFALRSDGLLFACGYNYYYQLGIGSNVWQSSFVQVPGLSNIVAVAAGFHDTFALRSDGVVFSCGYNHWGELGLGDHYERSSFTQIPGISNIISIAPSMLLRGDGLVFMPNSTSSFVQVVGLSNIVSCSNNDGMSLALRSDGVLLASGANQYGQLGIGNTVNQSSFVQSIGF